MLARIALITSVLVGFGCAPDGPTDIEPGSDISGDYRGCMDDECTVFTPSGMRFSSDHRVSRLRGVPPADAACEPPDETCLSEYTLCHVEDAVFREARWEWGDDGRLLLKNLPGTGDVVLRVDGRRIEVIPNAIFKSGIEYPQAQWMVRVDGETAPACSTP